MRNSEAFLNAFAKVERWVRDAAGADRTASFRRLIEQLESRNRVIRRYYSDLRQFAELRNVMVHERRGGKVLAEPTDETVSDLGKIAAILDNPPRVLPQFRKDVVSRHIDEPIGTAVADMRTGAFSQLPILSGDKVVALLTSETVVRWLASEVAEEIVSVTETPISNVLTHTEDKDHFRVVGSTTTLHDALSLFEEYAGRGKDLDAIVITESGDGVVPIHGILTVHDLPDVLKTLGIRRVSAT